ncbi:MAG TPA: hypothetical protein VEW28_07740 [Candidatus Kapabacteria bacterium]|nr:hypothetical protein [Candidatus Kapabacteria bacterium]
MKKAFFILFVLSTASGVAFGFAELLTYLKAHSDTDSITLDWQSGNESGVKSYSVERSDIKTDNFSEIGIVPATGSNSTYHFRDVNFNSIAQQGQGNAGHTAPLSDLFKYRLKINYDGSISYSQTITVTRPAAGVKHTWGMIKEMFR